MKNSIKLKMEELCSKHIFQIYEYFQKNQDDKFLRLHNFWDEFNFWLEDNEPDIFHQYEKRQLFHQFKVVIGTIIITFHDDEGFPDWTMVSIKNGR